MNIYLFRKENKRLAHFNKQEWSEVDIEHYGKSVIWKKELFFLEAREKGTTIGILNFAIEMGVAYVSQLLVAKNKRGGGVGRKLMEKAEAIAKQKKAHKIWLSTGKDWEAAKFYKNLGYKVTGKRDDHYLHKDFLEFSKFLF